MICANQNVYDNVFGGVNWWNSNWKEYSDQNVIKANIHINSLILMLPLNSKQTAKQLWIVVFVLLEFVINCVCAFRYSFKDNGIPVIDADLIAKQGN